MLEEKVSAFLKKKGLDLKNKKIVIGVSGGPDSIALLHYFWSRQQQFQIELIAAHVDHMFRGEESLQDAMFVKEYCRDKAIPFEMERVNVPEYMEKSGKSSQTAARDCRYSFYQRTAGKYGADYIALGHHGDDQVETILMRLTRGSAGSARAGIPFTRPFGDYTIIRPFLCLNRAEIESYCLKEHLNPRRDPSNEKGIYSRNRFRQEVLPFLRKENPQVHEHFQKFSEDLQSDEAYLQELTVHKMNTVMKKNGNEEISVNIDAFEAMPMPLQRRGIQLILNYLYKERPASLSASHIESIISLMKSPHPSGNLDFPGGLHIVRSYRQCHFLFPKEPVQSYRYEIFKPASIKLPNGGSIILEYADCPEGNLNNETLVLERDSEYFPIIIRTREKGDRMTLKGMQGSRKIKDIFIDHKIPLHDRKTWPIVTDAKGRILWVPGLKKSHVDRQQQSCTSYIILKYIK
ncbi:MULTISPECIES: tRNA lysidine(34) synthetase TilS [Cytobacillus]|uniref:tRNA lysidine(34) synthetase TilS n=1 Tax=Cytobacillus TaxID=2675230 RepID=UPI00203AC832|nr:tRNA lysidine(34) synthetase TilS [Cytobacillus firmus]MCM3707804.1 tRNA lysidine(34) synthetase TilS [Cytobacillus firmus]